MTTPAPLTADDWIRLLRMHVRSHPVPAIGLSAAVLGILLLLLQSLVVLAGHETTFLLYAMIGGGAGFLATALGAVPALTLRSIQHRTQDVMLGGVAGMMLAASVFSLLLPGLTAGSDILGSRVGGAALVVLGMALGVALMLGLDKFTPHQHDATGPCGPGTERCGRVWLLVFAIALHNLPEGLAIGVGFAQGDLSVGIPLSTAIALQDIPEGLAVALALRTIGISPSRAILIAAATGLLEPLGALIGVGIAGGLAVAYPIGLGLAAGAMIFVVSHEVIPETHRNGHQTLATIGLMIGFAIMMVLDTTLG